jgi:DNA-binding FadR family transcriptional regulator
MSGMDDLGAADADGALVQMRAYIAQGDFGPNDRLPPERALCDMLGVGRAQLRKAFSVLEAEGAIWRHVGRGTFVGDGRGLKVEPIEVVAKHTTPREVMRARLALEPQIAREAAIHGTLADLEALRRTDEKSRSVRTWREYEARDNQLHRLVAAAAHCAPLASLFDQLNALRRTVVWGRLRPQRERPPAEHHSYGEHARIIEAINERDSAAAEREMREHLRSVAARLFPDG